MTSRPVVRTVALASALLFGCAAPRITIREIAGPAAPGSAEPCVETGADGRAYLSWLEALGGGRHALRFSVWNGSGWSGPRTVAQGADWFVNWADFPSLTALDDGTLVAHWLRKTDRAPYAYAVMVSFSRDGGATWSEPLTPHDDSPTEHGFVSKVPLSGGRLAAIWLDGRETGGGPHGHSGPMTLRAAVLDSRGRIGREDRVDARVCDCCQTSAVRLDDGTLLVAYRDRSEKEIRDIAVVRFDGERWSEPSIVHDDGWETAGCPVNGPAIAADGDQVAVAWYTAAQSLPAPRVRIAFSGDRGATFAAPVDVDVGNPEGRVDVALLDDGSALVSWIEAGEASAQILARRVETDGSRGEPVPIAASSVARASGFPRMTRLGSDILMAWTERGDPSRIRTGLLSVPD